MILTIIAIRQMAMGMRRKNFNQLCTELLVILDEFLFITMILGIRLFCNFLMFLREKFSKNKVIKVFRCAQWKLEDLIFENCKSLYSLCEMYFFRAPIK